MLWNIFMLLWHIFMCLNCVNLMVWFCEFDPVSILEDQTDLNFVQYFIASTMCFRAQKVIKLQADTGNA